MMAVIIRS